MSTDEMVGNHRKHIINPFKSRNRVLFFLNWIIFPVHTVLEVVFYGHN